MRKLADIADSIEYLFRPEKSDETLTLNAMSDTLVLKRLK